MANTNRRKILGPKQADTLENMRAEGYLLKKEITNLVPGTGKYRRKMEELSAVGKHEKATIKSINS